jgi:hypothetical protein
MQGDDTREIVLPLQLVSILQMGDLLHFAGELLPFSVAVIERQTGLVRLVRDWSGPSYVEWVRARAGVR